MKMLRSTILVAAVCLAGAATGASSPVGSWSAAGGKARVKIAQCGDALCGTPSGGNAGVVFNLEGDGPNRWQASAFDPKDGQKHTVSMTMASDTRMVVKGCLAVFCVEQVWTRAN
jgi:uncharacterized protein (DUF2147 family)